ncbi:MAG: hypothetical protein LBS84_13040 [Clostridiales bacterium]|nr:hypothetical protein [Clostridiales bacterium]
MRQPARYSPISTHYIPIGRIITAGGLAAVIKYYDSLGQEFSDSIRDISRQTEKLRKLINFTFTRHDRYNLPECRLTAIEGHLRKRVSQLINLANGRTKGVKS